MNRIILSLCAFILIINVHQIECIDTLGIKLNEQSLWRRINADSVSSDSQNLTNCGGSMDCLIDFNQINEQNNILFSCENPELYTSTFSSYYGNPSFINFEVPDANLISDATFVLAGTATGENANITIECFNENEYVATILPNTILYDFSYYYVWDIPLSCFNITSNITTIMVSNYGTDCLAIDNAHMNVRSTFQKVNVTSTSTISCVLASDQNNCVEVLNYAYGNNLYGVGFPKTTFDWNVPSYQSLSNATAHIKGYTTADNSQIVLSCLNSSTNNQILRVWTSTALPAGTNFDYYVSVPAKCFVNFVARLGLDTSAATGLNISLFDLEVMTNGRAVPTFDATSSDCDASCLNQINSADGNYTTVCLDDSSVFHFLSLDYDSMKNAVLGIAAKSAGGTVLTVDCAQQQENSTISLGSVTLSNTNVTYFLPVPLPCFQNSDVGILVRNSSGNSCISMDFIRLYTDSAVPPNVALNEHGIEGYTDDVSFTNGDVVDLKISYDGSFNIEFYRIGFQEILVKTANVTQSTRQDYEDYAFKNGCGWNTTYSFKIPNSWKSGIYSARLVPDNNSSSFDLIFIVREKNPGKQGIKMVVLASVNTWLAYNEWGGASFYRYYGPDGSERKFRPNIPSNFLAITRPNPAAYSNFGMVHGEQFVLSWLEQRSYEYAVLADTDIHWNPSIINNYNTIIINTHGEYYSSEMYNALEDFLNDGKSLLNLGADAVYWKVTWNGSICENRKDATIHVQTGERGGLWRDLGRPESALLGAQFFLVDGITTSPFQVINSTDFVYENSGLNSSDIIGKGGYSLFGGSAAGWELDFMTPYSPADTVLVAHGMQINNSGNMVYYFHPAGGIVYDAGSLTYGGSLVTDDHLSVVLMNVLKAVGIESGLEYFELLPVTQMTSFTSNCSAECLDDINHSNHYLDYVNQTIAVVCDSEGFSNPTEIIFNIPKKYQSAKQAWLNLDAASQNVTGVNITCIDSFTQEVVATIASDVIFLTQPSYPRYPLPTQCIMDGTVTIQITKEDESDCLWVDYVGITLQSPKSSDSGSDKLSTLAIALIVVGCVLAVGGLVVAGYLWYKRRYPRTPYQEIH